MHKSRQDKVSVVRVAVKSLWSDKPITELKLDASLIMRNMGDYQESLIAISAADPELILAGFEAFICARSKGCLYAWAVLWPSVYPLADGVACVPHSCTDPDVLRLLTKTQRIWI